MTWGPVNARSIRSGVGALLALASALALAGVVAPPSARAAGTTYTVTDKASCTAFLAAVSGTGEPTPFQCYIYSATVPAGDTLVADSRYSLRPQGSTGDTAPALTVDGTLVLTSDGPPDDPALYVAGRVLVHGALAAGGAVFNFDLLDNQGGTVTVGAGVELYNPGTVDNQGTFRVAGTLTQAGTFSNGVRVLQTCTGRIDGTIGGLPVRGACPTTSVVARATPTRAQLHAPVALTATVTGQTPPGSAPTGTVRFLTTTGRPIGCSSVPLKSAGATAATATCTTTSLPLGAQVLRASYLGDTRYTALAANTGRVTITPPTPHVEVTARPHAVVRVRVETSPPDPGSRVRVSQLVDGRQRYLGTGYATGRGVVLLRAKVGGKPRAVRLLVTLLGAGYSRDRIARVTLLP